MKRQPLTTALVAAGLMLWGASCSHFVSAEVTREQEERIREAAPERPRVEPSKEHRVLIWSRAVGFRHSSIPHGALATKVMGEKTGAFTAEETDDLAMLLPEKLHEYDALILNNTTGNWIRPREEDLPRLGGGSIDELEQKLRASLLEFVEGGGGLVGYHSATDSNYHWEEFGKLIGGYFRGHPWHEKVGIRVEVPDHPLSQAFDGDFEIVDEIYQFRDPYSRDRLKVLLSLDPERTDMTKGGIARTDGDFAVAWIHQHGEGRVFYSSLGHREEIFWNPQIMEFYLDGIQFALGDLDADATPHPAP